MQTSITFADNLARMRKEARLTQGDLADFLGVTKASVSKWENAQSLPDIETLPKIATYFDTTIDALLGYRPQMSREGIRRACERLRAAFAEGPFDEALARSRALVRDYYACYPLLAQVALLYLNHFSLAPEAARQAFADEAIGLCRRIRANASSSPAVRQAEVVEAGFLLASGKPGSAVELLEDVQDVESGGDILLAHAYAATGEQAKADATLQGTLLQSLACDLTRLSELAVLHASEPGRLDLIHGRARALIDAFDFEKVFANTAAVHLSFAESFLAGGNPEKALDCLEDYERACRQLEFPLRLHGDAFFDRAGAWIEAVSVTGVDAPRDDAIVKQSLVSGVADNPALAPLAGNPRFERIVKSLRAMLR